MSLNAVSRTSSGEIATRVPIGTAHLARKFSLPHRAKSHARAAAPMN